MKKALTLTMLALLVAGAATVAIADSGWTGDASGQCGGYDILEHWVGDLDTEEPATGFYGYWGSLEDNLMYGGATETSSGSNIWDVDDGDWNSDGASYDYYGTWEGRFNENTGHMAGTWEGTNVQCDGYLWGEMDD